MTTTEIVNKMKEAKKNWLSCCDDLQAMLETEEKTGVRFSGEDWNVIAFARDYYAEEYVLYHNELLDSNYHRGMIALV